MAADPGDVDRMAASEVIDLGEITELTAGGEDTSTENKRDPYD